MHAVSIFPDEGKEVELEASPDELWPGLHIKVLIMSFGKSLCLKRNSSIKSEKTIIFAFSLEKL